MNTITHQPSDVGGDEKPHSAEVLSHSMSALEARGKLEMPLIPYVSRTAPCLQHGDVIRIIPIDTGFSPDYIFRVSSLKKTLESKELNMELKVQVSPYLTGTASDHSFETAREFVEALNDEKTKMIWLASRFKMTSRPFLDEVVKGLTSNGMNIHFSKIVVGGGRTSALLNGLHTFSGGLITFLGCEPCQTQGNYHVMMGHPSAFARFERRFGPDADDQMIKLALHTFSADGPDSGDVHLAGKLIGGDLEELHQVVTSNRYSPSFDNTVLLLESNGTTEERFRSICASLNDTTLFDRIAGVLIGAIDLDLESNFSNQQIAARIISQYMAKLTQPIVICDVFGPKAPGYFLPIGGEVRIDAASRTLLVKRCVSKATG